MALDIGLGGGGRPVPTTNKPTLNPVPIPSNYIDPTLAGDVEYIPPVDSGRPAQTFAPQTTPIVETPGLDISSATEYRGHYYEMGHTPSGWIWFVYIGTQTSWGISGVAIGGGTSDSEAAALEQVHGIIDGITDNPDYVPPPIDEEFDLGIDVPTFGDSYLGMFDSAVVPIDSVLIGGGGGGNGTSEPIYEMGPQVSGVTMVRIVGIAVLYYGLAALNRKW